VLCGGTHKLVAVDVDVLNPFAANELQKLIGDELGFAPRRIGKAPKFLMLFRCTQLISKIQSTVFVVDGVSAQVEILAEGQQFVASGIHPDTNKRYEWPDDCITDLAPLDLTEVTPEQLKSFLKKADGILANYGDPETERTAVSHNQLIFQIP
jgi:putative DNA primase/helicase